MKTLFLILISTLLSTAAVAQNGVAEGDYFFTLEVTFGPGQKKLSPASKRELRRIIEENVTFYQLSLHTKKANTQPQDLVVKSSITIGRTDAAGDEYKNQVVSQERAAVLDAEIRAIIASLGVRSSPEAFFYMGVGEQDANENECTVEQKLCSNNNEPTLPWDVYQPCYRNVLVCPASQRISNAEIILTFSPVAAPSPSIIQIPAIESKNPQDVEPEPKVDESTDEKPAVVTPAIKDPAVTDQKPITDVVPQPEVTAKPATETDGGVETKPKPNKLKVYGSEIE